MGGGHRAGSGMGGGFGGGSMGGGPGGGRRSPGGGMGGGPDRGPVPPPPGRGSVPPPPPRRGPIPPPSPGPGRRGADFRRSPGCLGTIFAVLLFFVILGVVFSVPSGSGYGGSSAVATSGTSTIQRQKLESGNSYMNDCIVDELGWFDNVSSTEAKLKEFWEDTGVQPYIILKAYDASLDTGSESENQQNKEQWSRDYYEANFDREDIFLFVYFAEEDAEGQVGYMTYTNGYQVTSVMDSEAVEIFWNNIDKYWYSNASTDDVFINAFNDTATTIMKVSTTSKDILKWVIIAVVVIAAGVILIRMVKLRNQRAKEKAEEDQKILNTPINDLAKDDLENKYL
jgi:hypothetical protein